MTDGRNDSHPLSRNSDSQVNITPQYFSEHGKFIRYGSDGSFLELSVVVVAVTNAQDKQKHLDMVLLLFEPQEYRTLCRAINP